MLFLSSLHHFSFPRQRERSQQGMVGLTWRPRRSLRSWKETSKCWRWEHPWILRGSTRRTTEMAFPNTFRSVELSSCFLVLYTRGYQLCFYSPEHSGNTLSISVHVLSVMFSCVRCRLVQWWTTLLTSIIPVSLRRRGREPLWRSCSLTQSSDSKWAPAVGVVLLWDISPSTLYVHWACRLGNTQKLTEIIYFFQSL